MKIFKYLFYFVISICLLAGVIFIIKISLEGSVLPHELKKIKSYLEESWGCKIVHQSRSIDWSEKSIFIDGVTFKNKKGMNVTWDRIQVKFNSIELLPPKLNLEKVTIIRPKLHVSFPKGKQEIFPNILNYKKGNEKRSEKRSSLSINIHQGKIAFFDLPTDNESILNIESFQSSLQIKPFEQMIFECSGRDTFDTSSPGKWFVRLQNNFFLEDTFRFQVSGKNINFKFYEMIQKIASPVIFEKGIADVNLDISCLGGLYRGYGYLNLDQVTLSVPSQNLLSGLLFLKENIKLPSFSSNKKQILDVNIIGDKDDPKITMGAFTKDWLSSNLITDGVSTVIKEPIRITRDTFDFGKNLLEFALIKVPSKVFGLSESEEE